MPPDEGIEEASRDPIGSSAANDHAIKNSRRYKQMLDFYLHFSGNVSDRDELKRYARAVSRFMRHAPQ